VVLVFWLGVVVVVWLGVVVVVRDGDVAPAGVVDWAPAGGPVAWAANAVVIANKSAIKKILRMKTSPGGLLLRFFGCVDEIPLLLVGCAFGHKR
jgi:hypothetical protein